MKRVLDTTAGSRMIWFDKKNPDVVYMDNRELTDILCDGRPAVIPGLRKNTGYWVKHGRKTSGKAFRNVYGFCGRPGH